MIVFPKQVAPNAASFRVPVDRTTLDDVRGQTSPADQCLQDGKNLQVCLFSQQNLMFTDSVTRTQIGQSRELHHTASFLSHEV